MVMMPWADFNSARTLKPRRIRRHRAPSPRVLAIVLLAAMACTAALAGAAPRRSVRIARTHLTRQIHTETDGELAAWARVPVGQAEFGSFSQNGRWTVTTENGERVRITSLDGTILHTLANPTQCYLHYARISPDGQRAIGVAKKAAVVWDLPSGRVARVVEAHPDTDLTGFRVAASPDAACIAVLERDGVTQVLDARTGAVAAAHRGRPGSLFFSEDGTRVVTSTPAGDGADRTAPGLEVWDARTGAVAARFALDLEALDGCAVCWGISRDAGRIAVADAEEGRLYLYDAARGPQPKVIAARLARMTGISYSPNGRTLTTADAGGADIRDALTGHAIRGLSAPGSAIQHAAYSADGRWIATAGGDHTIRIWDAASGRLTRVHRVLADGAGFRMVCITPNGGAVLGVGDDEESYLWHMGEPRRAIVAYRR